MEVSSRFELLDKSFADSCLTAWLTDRLDIRGEMLFGISALNIHSNLSSYRRYDVLALPHESFEDEMIIPSWFPVEESNLC